LDFFDRTLVRFTRSSKKAEGKRREQRECTPESEREGWLEAWGKLTPREKPKSEGVKEGRGEREPCKRRPRGYIGSEKKKAGAICSRRKGSRGSHGRYLNLGFKKITKKKKKSAGVGPCAENRVRSTSLGAANGGEERKGSTRRLGSVRDAKRTRVVMDRWTNEAIEKAMDHSKACGHAERRGPRKTGLSEEKEFSQRERKNRHK